MKSQFTTVAADAEPTVARHIMGGRHVIKIAMPGKIVNVEGDNLVTIEVDTGNESIINEKEFERITSDLSHDERNRLYRDMNDSAIIKLIRATLTIKV